MKGFWILTAVLLCGLAACKKGNNWSKTPNITLKQLAPNTVRAGNSEDTVFVSFSYTDGDADLGVDPQSGFYDIYMKDSRDTTVFRYLFPPIEDDMRDPDRGMEGTFTVFVHAAFLLPRQDSLHLATGDTLQYELYIRDRAGHESNRIITPDIYLLP